MRAPGFFPVLLAFLVLIGAGLPALDQARAQPYGAPPAYGDPDYAPVPVQYRGQYQVQYPAPYRGPVQPLDRILPGIRRSHPGEFYDADGPTWGPDGDPHYHLKWLTPDGRVVWFDADARSGRVLRASPGRDAFDGRQGPPPPGYTRAYGPGAPGGYGPAYPSYTPRFVGPRFVGPGPGGRGYGGFRGGGRWRH